VIDDVTPEELAASEAAYQDYLAGRDPGLSSKELKAELFGKKLERMGHCPETSSSLLGNGCHRKTRSELLSLDALVTDRENADFKRRCVQSQHWHHTRRSPSAEATSTPELR